jgi:FtsX-like permease family protein
VTGLTGHRHRASSTIVGLADALFLRPRPGLEDESRLLDIGRVTSGQGFDNFGYLVLLARAMARGREIATRLAVGAGRAQIVAQLLTETLLLFTVAAVASVALSWWMVAFLESFIPTLPIPVTLDRHVDARVLAFALGLALVTAWSAARRERRLPWPWRARLLGRHPAV